MVITFIMHQLDFYTRINYFTTFLVWLFIFLLLINHISVYSDVNLFTGSGLKLFYFRTAALRRFLQKIDYSLKIRWYQTTIQCKPIKCIYFLEVCIFFYQMILFWVFMYQAHRRKSRNFKNVLISPCSHLIYLYAWYMNTQKSII